MKRRTLLQLGVGTALATPLLTAVRGVFASGPRQEKLDAAAAVLTKAVDEKQVDAAALCVRQGKNEFIKSFGAAKSSDAMFLLGSISKTMSVAALMTLLDQGKFRLEDPAKKFLPEFTGGSRDKVTVGQLLTHVSGLPDQLPENQALAAATPAWRSSLQPPLRHRCCLSRGPAIAIPAWPSCWRPRWPSGSAERIF